MAAYKEISRNNWKVTITFTLLNGKKKRISKQGFKTQKEAKKYALTIENRKNQFDYLNSSDIYLKDFIFEWFNDYKSLRIAITTHTSYLGRINNYIIPYLGKYKLTEINNRILQRFYNNLVTKNNLKASSASKVYQIISNCLAYAKKQNLISNISTNVEKKETKKTDILCWSKEEASYFLSEIEGEYLYTPVLIALNTGLRVGELCGLKWCDIDLDNSIINVTHQIIFNRELKVLVYTDILKTPSSYRKITLSKKLVEYLRHVKEENTSHSDDFVIVDEDGKMNNPRNLSMRFTRKVAKYKNLKRITFHGLRHTHASILISANENSKIVSERLGHKSIVTTLDTYTHINLERHKKTANLLDGLL